MLYWLISHLPVGSCSLSVLPCSASQERYFPGSLSLWLLVGLQAESWSPKGEKPDYFPHPHLLECLLYLPVGLRPLRPWLLTPPTPLTANTTFLWFSSPRGYSNFLLLLISGLLSHPSCFPPLPSPMRSVPYNWFLLCEIPTVLAVSWLDFVDCYLCQWTGVSMSSSPCWCPAQNLFARQVNPTYDCTVGSWIHSSPENCPCPQILVDSQVVQW